MSQHGSSLKNIEGYFSFSLLQPDSNCTLALAQVASSDGGEYLPEPKVPFLCLTGVGHVCVYLCGSMAAWRLVWPVYFSPGSELEGVSWQHAFLSPDK